MIDLAAEIIHGVEHPPEAVGTVMWATACARGGEGIYLFSH